MFFKLEKWCVEYNKFVEKLFMKFFIILKCRKVGIFLYVYIDYVMVLIG